MLYVATFVFVVSFLKRKVKLFFSLSYFNVQKGTVTVDEIISHSAVVQLPSPDDEEM